MEVRLIDANKLKIDLKVRKQDCAWVSKLDAQVPYKKTIFGGGLLLSTAKAAERAAAHKWELSGREKEIVKILDSRAKGRHEPTT